MCLDGLWTLECAWTACGPWNVPGWPVDPGMCLDGLWTLECAWTAFGPWNMPGRPVETSDGMITQPSSVSLLVITGYDCIYRLTHHVHIDWFDSLHGNEKTQLSLLWQSSVVAWQKAKYNYWTLPHYHFVCNQAFVSLYLHGTPQINYSYQLG